MISSFRCALVLLCFAFSATLASAQSGQTVQADRIAVHPDVRATTTLTGHVPAWAVGGNDRGSVLPDTHLRLTFVLSRSAALQTAFTQLLADQQNPGSPSYHHWLTPQQVGELYGPTQHDLNAVTSWLASQGLTVMETAPSRVFVTVGASVSAVTTALATNFRYFNVNGQSRLATTVDPSIPSAFASVISSISGLADSDVRPMHRALAMTMSANGGVTGGQPEFTNGAAHYMTPGDFAVIFDLKPAYSAGYTGAGQRVAILGRSRVAASDISEFESRTGLATNLPNTIIPTTGTDPGVTGDGDQGEATLDVDRVIGTAPGVQADLVVSSDANGGIEVAAQYEVQTLLDPVMTISFGSCELNSGPSGVGFWDAIFSQAASEGISAFVSAGDAGAAGCDTQFAAPPAYQFRSINYICASSYVTCVGGTELVEGANPAQYWTSTNSASMVSALGYIPEGAWNEPESAAAGTSFVVAAGGGGASMYVPKPGWQTGTGVPSDDARDVPDISFPAAGHDGYFACFAAGGGDCSSSHFVVYSGTSAAAPSMAAVAALLNQKTGSSQGSMNPLLYRLAASSPGAFHDAAPATINDTVCFIVSASICNNSTPSSNLPTGGLAGFALTTGYDQATGLGSLDVGNFLTAAATPKSALAPTALSLRESSSVISDTQTATFTANITSATAGTPSGTVQFYADGSTLGSPVALVAGAAVTAALPFPAAGSYYITATYSGDGTYASTTAPGVALTVTGLTALTNVTASSTTIPVGTTATFKVTVAPLSGSVIPTGLVRFFAVSGTGGGYLATVPLSGGTATTPPITLSAVGSYILTADYMGDSVYSASMSAAVPYTVQKLASVIQLSTAEATIGTGGSEIFNATIMAVTGGSSAPAPSGTIQLYANGVALGAPFSATPTLNQGGLDMSSPELFSIAGAYSITAVYSGDANWLPSTTNGVAGGLTTTVLPTPASFQVLVASPTLSFSAGATIGNTDPIAIRSTLGFTGTVNLTCSVASNGASTVASAPTCSLFNSSVTLDPVLGSSTTLTINSTASQGVQGAAISASRPPNRNGWRSPVETALCALLLCFVPRHRSWRALVVLFVMAAGFSGLSGCSSSGGGSSASTPTQTAPPVGTTASSYTVTVTASTTVAGAPTVPPITIALTVN